jgi:hypothetical protein
MCGVTLLPDEKKICIFCENSKKPEEEKKENEDKKLWWKRESENLW